MQPNLLQARLSYAVLQVFTSVCVFMYDKMQKPDIMCWCVWMYDIQYFDRQCTTLHLLLGLGYLVILVCDESGDPLLIRCCCMISLSIQNLPDWGPPPRFGPKSGRQCLSFGERRPYFFTMLDFYDSVWFSGDRIWYFGDSVWFLGDLHVWSLSILIGRWKWPWGRSIVHLSRTQRIGQCGKIRRCTRLALQ